MPAPVTKAIAAIFKDSITSGALPSDAAIERCAAEIWFALDRPWAEPLIPWDLVHAIAVVLRDAPDTIKRLSTRSDFTTKRLLGAFMQLLAASEELTAICLPRNPDAKKPKVNGKANLDHREWRTVFRYVHQSLSQAEREAAELASIEHGAEIEARPVTNTDTSPAVQITVRVIEYLQELGKWKMSVPQEETLGRMLRRRAESSRLRRSRL